MSPGDSTLRAAVQNAARLIHPPIKSADDYSSELSVTWRPTLREHLDQSWSSQGNYCASCEQSFLASVPVCPNDGTVFAEVRRIESLLFNRYQVLSLVGTGGMGTVFKGKQQPLDRLVAIKFLKQQDKEHDEVFRQEARLASLLDHPNIIHVYDFGHAKNGQPFMIMDFVDGGDLDALLKRTTLTIDESMHIFRQICQGMAHAHAKGIVHCDIKPSNILLSNLESSHPTVYLADFGIAKAVATPVGLNARKPAFQMPLGASQQMTARTARTDLQAIGSPYYMSPEQALGNELDARSDIYSLGCVMYEALSGMVPIAGNTPFDTLRMRVEERPLSLKERCPGRHIPECLENVVMKALAKEPSKRFQTTNELDAALDNVSKILQQKEHTRKVFSISSSSNAESSRKKANQKPEASRSASRHQATLRKLNAILVGAASLTLLGGLGAFCFTELCPRVAPAKSQSDSNLDDLIKKVAVATDATKPRTRSKTHEASGYTKERPLGETDLLEIDTQKVMIKKGPQSEIELTEEIAGGAKPNGIALAHTSLTDHALYCLRGITELRSLSLSDASYSNEVLEPLKDIPNIKTLNLDTGHLTDGFTQYVKTLNHLQDLDLSAQTKLSANCLKQLPTSLLTLSLKWDNGISREGFAELVRYKKLKTLSLSSTRLADGDLRFLRGLNDLEHLDIGSTIITDDGVAELMTLPKLNDLDISKTKISRDGLLKLAKATNLKKLRCFESDVLKKEDFDAFRRATKQISLTPEEPNRENVYTIDDPDYASLGSTPKKHRHSHVKESN
ncbi:MAG TPA: protein kinase [Oculatellaceae cyanobacterium]